MVSGNSVSRERLRDGTVNIITFATIRDGELNRAEHSMVSERNRPFKSSLLLAANWEAEYFNRMSKKRELSSLKNTSLSLQTMKLQC